MGTKPKSKPIAKAPGGGNALNRSLHAAKSAKQNEFYTQCVDIQKEVEAYLEFDPNTFEGKIVYCNCYDPFENNFFKYFAANFNNLGLKKLITTRYDGSPIVGQMSLFPEHTEGNGKRQKPKAVGVIVDNVKDENNDGATDIEDVKLLLNRNKANHLARDLRRGLGKNISWSSAPQFEWVMNVKTCKVSNAKRSH